MGLFDNEIDTNRNLLPKDGMVNYYGSILSSHQHDHYFDKLLNTTDWKNDVAIIFGKKIVTKRKVAWYGDVPFGYTYSNVKKSALPWTPILLELKNSIESKTGETFNSCLLNLYHNGGEGMSWHSDAEKELKKNGAIASLSLGAERKFAFKHKQTKQRIPILLERGSLLLMKGETQSNWLHHLPKTTKVTTPRINLTFRTMVNK